MIFEQCKVGRYFAWAGRDPGIKSPVRAGWPSVTGVYFANNSAKSSKSCVPKT